MCLDLQEYVCHGSIKHGIKGKGHWREKIERIAQQIGEQVPEHCPDLIVIEKPTYQAWGSKSNPMAAAATATSLLATMDCAWSIAWELRQFEIRFLRPDNARKGQRAAAMDRLIHGLPTRTNEHVRDAGWLALRIMGLA